MNNFEFVCPTKIIFGKDAESHLGTEIKKYSDKILLLYGGGSIKKSGLYNKIAGLLKEAGIEFIEMGGVMPNPRLDMVQKGIKICRENNINFILAIGGGSVIDSAKAISIGVPYNGNVWDFYIGKAVPKEAMAVGDILTIPASGSEASRGSVITNEAGMLKRSLNNDLLRPRFAIMNPEITFTLPHYQTSCGLSDILSHVMERYFTNVPNVELTDRLCEATMKTVISNAEIVLNEPENYSARSEIMWAGTIAHNDLLSTGRIGDFTSHMIEHELSGINDVAHGAGLAIITPAWMKYVYKHGIERFVQFAVKVWNVEQSFTDPEKTALEGINKLTDFYKMLGLPVTLKEIGISEKDFDLIADKCKKSDSGTVGNYVKLNREDIINILNLAK